MASHTLSPSIWTGLSTMLGDWTMSTTLPSRLAPSPEERRAEQEFVNEMIWSNPGAFSGELDVQNAMQVYPGGF